MDLKLVRTSGSEINVSWTGPGLVEARGFVEYTLEYSPTTPTRTKRQTGHTCSGSPCTVPISRGSVLLTNLDAKETYLVTVRPMNEDGDMGTLMSDTGKSHPLTKTMAIPISYFFSFSSELRERPSATAHHHRRRGWGAGGGRDPSKLLRWDMLVSWGRGSKAEVW